MEGFCFIKGQWMALKEASLSICDLGVIRGYGVFDYVRTYHRRPFHLWDHFLRFKRSADILELSLSYSFEEIETLVEEILDKTPFPEVGLKLLLTGGQSGDQFSLENAPTFCLMAYPPSPFPTLYYHEGIAVCTTRHLRPLPQAKSTCYLTALTAMQEAKRRSAVDVFYVNSYNHILEALTSNIFVVKKQKLITPISNEILPGITREVVRKCAHPDIEVETSSLSLLEMETWDEVFITSTTREIMPVVRIDGKPIGDGKVGPLSKEMLRRFRAYTETLEWAPLWNAGFLKLKSK